MKKFLAMLLVAAMVFSMAACAKAPEAAQPAATEETAGETAETAEAPNGRQGIQSSHDLRLQHFRWRLGHVLLQRHDGRRREARLGNRRIRQH